MTQPVANREMFAGRWEQNSKVFLQNLQYQMALSSIATADAKAQFFPLCLEIDSPADLWFQKLDPAVHLDRDKLEPQFTKCWVPEIQQSATELAMDKTEDLLECKLKPDEVGQRVPFRGTVVYGHVAWAEEMFMMVQRCGLENRIEYICQVMKELLKLVQSSIVKSFTDWAMFLEAVKGINTDQLEQRIQAEKDLHELRVKVNELQKRRASLTTDKAHISTMT
jgi:hypothetical protein